MLKASKPSHKLHKSSRVSPIRKEHLMKKTLHTSSSMRVSGTQRPSTMKRLSPSMKRIPIMPPSKSMHSPRLRSIASSPHRPLRQHTMQDSPVSMDRGRHLKSSKYEKRKVTPPSPIRHPMTTSSASLDIREASPYQDDRYLSGRSATHDPHFSPPLKKKPRREPDRYERSSRSPGMALGQRPEVSLHSGGRMPPHRNELPPRSSSISIIPHPGQHRGHMSSSVHDNRSDHFDVHNRGQPGSLPVMSSTHSKRPPPPIKTTYDNQRPERYRSPSPVERYPPNKPKRYAPTLHERFSTVVETARTEPRLKYSREDLEKITIDIHRNIKTPSPTLRRIVNPNDVKLVRRANEGHRPMFDREEIKQAPRDMREDAYYEKKTTTDGAYSSMSSINLREVDNYEITRHRFDPHPATFHSTSGRSLSDRWQSAKGRKDSTGLDRDHREYERQHIIKKGFVETRSKSGDRDFRSERYPGGEPSNERPNYHGSQLGMSSPTERRSNLPIHRKESSIPDARRRMNVRRGSDREPPTNIRPEQRSRYPSQVEKRYEGLSTRIEKHYSDHRSPGLEPHKWVQKNRSTSRESMPEFVRRPDKYSHKSWPDKQDLSPRGPNYYEPDLRDDPESYRGRGSSRPFRSLRGLRARGFRGNSRGGFPTRPSYRGGYRNSSNLRGRGPP